MKLFSLCTKVLLQGEKPPALLLVSQGVSPAVQKLTFILFSLSSSGLLYIFSGISVEDPPVKHVAVGTHSEYTVLSIYTV